MEKRIDVLNIVLIFLSLIVAIFIPFKLFLFSYAILGPLHYLTEINWLKDKGYFVSSNSKWIKVFIIFTVFISIYPIYKLFDFALDNSFSGLLKFVSGNYKIFILTAFLFSTGLLFFRKAWQLALNLLASFIIAIGMYFFLPKWLFLLGLFLPTIVHVYLFTLLFMLYGNMKSKSGFGFLGSALLLLVPFFIIFMNIDVTSYMVSQRTATIYDASKFLNLNYIMTGLFDGYKDGKFYVLSPVGIKVQIFIAFAYTYHYLNWFSKTSIIGWKKSLTKRKSLYILLIWASAVGIYLYDFYTGLIALYFLSVLHVLFEFPLNAITIKSLFRFKRKKVAV
ncbi:MAG TPA: hypothetical protein PKW08_00870 [Flavobacteriaceae bacterium]|nr:hypothetical protein [Flavobacteriaceae bacterium]MCB9212363.1 hypothetical protein [Alteromonas sp.]HPF11639.1 hypothetical protein [Flavobacteriaceae bacterium]HQU20114.1 hypothetical protein [Flavobacteriaceae bacterium]HQU64797.1 hypothetical protein [Flavobacteriaceae bacterium]